jgi:hypothetical protein
MVKNAVIAMIMIISFMGVGTAISQQESKPDQTSIQLLARMDRLEQAQKQILQKLDTVLANQQKILSELDIVKVRATRR